MKATSVSRWKLIGTILLVVQLVFGLCVLAYGIHELVRLNEAANKMQNMELENILQQLRNTEPKPIGAP